MGGNREAENLGCAEVSPEPASLTCGCPAGPTSVAACEPLTPTSPETSARSERPRRGCETVITPRNTHYFPTHPSPAVWLPPPRLGVGSTGELTGTEGRALRGLTGSRAHSEQRGHAPSHTSSGSRTGPALRRAPALPAPGGNWVLWSATGQCHCSMGGCARGAPLGVSLPCLVHPQ